MIAAGTGLASLIGMWYALQSEIEEAKELPSLETLYQYRNKITHGEAISIGMIIASKLSNKLSTLKTNELIKITNHLCKVGLPIYDNEINNKKILSIIQKDKKNRDGKINLILLKKIGKAYYSRNVNQKHIINISN